LANVNRFPNFFRQQIPGHCKVPCEFVRETIFVYVKVIIYTLLTGTRRQFIKVV